MTKRRGAPIPHCPHEWSEHTAKGYRYCIHCNRRYRDTWIGICITCGLGVWKPRAKDMPDPAHCQHMECAILEAHGRTNRIERLPSGGTRVVLSDPEDSHVIDEFIRRGLCD